MRMHMCQCHKCSSGEPASVRDAAGSAGCVSAIQLHTAGMCILPQGICPGQVSHSPCHVCILQGTKLLIHSFDHALSLNLIEFAMRQCLAAYDACILQGRHTNTSHATMQSATEWPQVLYAVQGQRRHISCITSVWHGIAAACSSYGQLPGAVLITSAGHEPYVSLGYHVACARQHWLPALAGYR